MSTISDNSLSAAFIFVAGAGEERGSQLFEATLVFLILVTPLIGSFCIGRAHNLYQTITRSAREGARWRKVREDTGAEIVEAALVLPLLLMLLLGVFWMGRAYNVHASITRAAREGARYAATPTCSTCGGTFPSASQVQAVVDGSLSAASLDPAKKLSYSFQRGVVLNPGSAYSTETGVVISFTYPVRLTVPFTSINNTTINIPTVVQMREEK